MGTLGKLLRDTRESRGIDLRDAAQQTRISVQYLKALEAEDFSKLPGTVFVRGFLKNYGKFLRLDEAEVMRRYAETQQAPSPAGAAVQPSTSAPQVAPQATEEAEAQPGRSERVPIEPFIWGAGIIIVLVIALFSALPQRHAPEATVFPAPPSPAGVPGFAPPSEQAKPEKLYLEVRALGDTWLLVRIDSSPQKKAILKKGESLIWSADERFAVSYSSAGAVQLLLNGKELVAPEPKNAVVRDMAITADGIVNKNIQPEYVRPAKRRQLSPATFGSPTAPPAVVQPGGQPKHTPPATPAPVAPQHPQTPAKLEPAVPPRAPTPGPAPEPKAETAPSPAAPAPAQPEQSPQ